MSLHRLTLFALAAICTGCTLVGDLDKFQSGTQAVCTRPDAKSHVYVGEGTMAIMLDNSGEGGAGGMSGQGGEELEVLSLEQQLGPEMPVTITHDDDCCWVFRIELSENRIDTVTYCSDTDGRIEKKGEVQLQNWVVGVGLIKSTTTIDCETGDVVRPAMDPGETWTHLCSGGTDLVAGDYFSNTTWEYEGGESLEVNGAQVPAHRYNEHRVFSGASTGALDATVWIAEDNGQPLKTTSSVTLESTTDLGAVTYTEVAEWQAQER